MVIAHIYGCYRSHATRSRWPKTKDKWEEYTYAFKVQAKNNEGISTYEKSFTAAKTTGKLSVAGVSLAADDIILTDELMWDQHGHRIFSDAFIHIEKQGRIIEGYGYESNERLTTYQLRQVEAIFPIDEKKMPHPGSGNAAPKTMQ